MSRQEEEKKILKEEENGELSLVEQSRGASEKCTK